MKRRRRNERNQPNREKKLNLPLFKSPDQIRLSILGRLHQLHMNILKKRCRPTKQSSDLHVAAAAADDDDDDDGDYQYQYQQLLPGLPDHLAQLCLSKVNNPSLLYSVCHSWRKLIYSSSFPPFSALYALLSSSSSPSSSSIQTQETHETQEPKSSNSIQFSSFDPISSKWKPLPPPPPDLLLPPLLLRHPSFIARDLPIQSVTVSNHLILLAATTHELIPALSHPLIFNPLTSQWRLGQPISTPRRWCATGSVRGSLYVASGVGSCYNKEVAQSVERWDLNKDDCWEKVSPLKNGRFSREAVEAVGWRGKLCMVNIVNGNEGLVYDVDQDLWEEMPKGMLVGWSGPAAAMDEDVIYLVDVHKGVLRKYNPEMDSWEDVIEAMRLKGAVQIVANGGRVCVACSGGDCVAVIDVTIRPARMWVVEPPPGTQFIATHVLPRMVK